MNDWAPKRFWTDTAVAETDGGYHVLLDSRSVRTPAKAPLVVPTHAMAGAIAEEWQAQGEKIDPTTMPVTRAANATIDKVIPQFDEVVDHIAAYGGSDLLCYRATTPEGLARKQAESWDPWLVWAANALDAPLRTTAGVMPVAQTPEALARMRGAIAELTPYSVAAVYDLVQLSGSLVLGLAVIRERLAPDEAWRLSRIDEDWQIAEWGEDEEAAEMAETKRRAFVDAARFHQLTLT